MENFNKNDTLIVNILSKDFKSKIESEFNQYFIYINNNTKISYLDEIYSNLVRLVIKNNINNLIINSENKYIKDILIYFKNYDIKIYNNQYKKVK